MRAPQLVLLALTTLLPSSAQATSALIPAFLPPEKLPFIRQVAEKLDQESPRGPGIACDRWSEIKSWRALGTRWAAGLDGKGHAIAIYDLSLDPRAGSANFGHLAVIGGPGFNLNRVHELLAVAAASSSGKVRRKALRALHALDSVPDLKQKNLLPDDWYRGLPWKASFKTTLGDLSAPPRSFKLSDFDYNRIAVNPKLFAQGLRYLAPFGYDLDRLQYTRQADGSYALDLLPATAKAPKSDDGPVRPTMLADLKSVNTGLYQTIAWFVSSEVRGFIVGLIPNPIISALVGTALGRLGTWRHGVIHQHRDAAHEMINAAVYAEGPHSPFASLTHDELRNAGVSLHLAEMTILGLWDWISKGAEGAWRADLATDARRSAEARAWLEAHATNIQDLNARYLLASMPQSPTHGSPPPEADRKLYLLAHFRWLGANQEPVPGVDYDHPERAIILRTTVEAASITVQYAMNFVPLVGGVISTVFDWIFRSPVQSTVGLEARLAAHLEERERVSNENWEYELATLDRQQLNPLDLAIADRRALVAKFSAELGLPPQPKAPLE